MTTRMYRIRGSIDLDVCGRSITADFKGFVEYEPADAIDPPNTNIEASITSTYSDLATQVEEEDLGEFPGGIDAATELSLLTELEESWESYVQD